MEARLTEFLLSISEEPNKLAVWQENPDSLLDATNLTPGEKAIIKSGNSVMLDRAIAEELYQSPELFSEASTIRSWRIPILPLRPLGLIVVYSQIVTQENIELLRQLQISIESEPNLKAEDRDEALEQLKVLAEAEKNPEAMKKQAGTAIKILRGTTAVLPSTAKLIETSNKLLPAIAQRLSLG